MEPPQAKPVRRRRRWMIVALLLVLLSGVAWWDWPRGDSRFVGKWNDVNGNIWEFRGNGLYNAWLSGASLPSAWTTWNCEGDLLQLGASPTAVMHDFERPFVKLMMALSPGWRRSIGRYKVTWVTADSIIIDKGAAWGNARSPATLTRIPE